MQEIIAKKKSWKFFRMSYKIVLQKQQKREKQI